MYQQQIIHRPLLGSGGMWGEEEDRYKQKGADTTYKSFIFSFMANHSRPSSRLDEASFLS